MYTEEPDSPFTEGTSHSLVERWYALHARTQSYDVLTSKSLISASYMCVEAQISIFKSTCARMPARHINLEKKTRLTVFVLNITVNYNM